MKKTKGSKKNKQGKQSKLGYRLLLKVETVLSLLFGFTFLSAKFTGFAVENSGSSNIAVAGSIFLILGILGLTTLIFSRNQKMK